MPAICLSGSLSSATALQEAWGSCSACLCPSFLGRDVDLTTNISPEGETGLTHFHAPLLAGILHRGDSVVKLNSQNDRGGSEGR